MDYQVEFNISNDMFKLLDPEIMYFLHGLNPTENTPYKCPFKIYY
jgi:hypothetical protein